MRTEKMQTTDTSTKGARRFGPALVALPFTTVIFGFYAKFMDVSAVWIPVMALVGLGWGWLIGAIVKRLSRRPALRRRVEDVVLGLGIVASGFLLCGGVMSGLLMGAALDTPSLTYETLSAMMAPTLPYFIMANSPMEMIIVPAVIFLTWRSARRVPVLIAGVAYFVMRVWTHLVYAEQRAALATRERLSAADVQWFQETLSVDHRLYLNLIVFVFFIVAALVPIGAARGAVRPRGRSSSS